MEARDSPIMNQSLGDSVDNNYILIWMERFLVLTWLILSRPRWAWNWIWFSPYNPFNLTKYHLKQFRDYELHEDTLTEIIQRACRASYEQAKHTLNEFDEIRLSRELEGSVIPARYDASEKLAKLCYSMVRLTIPSIIVETGVGRGVTSYYILKALEKNGKGHLYSFELPPLMLGAKKDVGRLVPLSLRNRWSLNFGIGIYEMKKLSGKIKKIDMFIHDSNHTYLNQLSEYKIALAWLKSRGILISDDVGNDALLEVNKKFDSEMAVTKRTKQSNNYIGIVLKK